MRDINRVTLLGNLTFDVESHKNGVVSFKLGTSESWRDKETGETKSVSEYHRVVCFSKLGEVVHAHIKKGDRVFVEGSVSTNSWEDKEGIGKKTTEIVARSVEKMAVAKIKSLEEAGQKNEGCKEKL